MKKYTYEHSEVEPGTYIVFDPNNWVLEDYYGNVEMFSSRDSVEEYVSRANELLMERRNTKTPLGM